MHHKEHSYFWDPKEAGICLKLQIQGSRVLGGDGQRDQIKGFLNFEFV